MGVVRLVYQPVNVPSARWNRPMSCHVSGNTNHTIGAPGSSTTASSTRNGGPPKLSWSMTFASGRSSTSHSS